MRLSTRALALMAVPLTACIAGSPPEEPYTAGPGGGGSLQIVSATYGANLGAVPGNVTDQVSRRCGGSSPCVFAVRAAELFPPPPSCAPFADVSSADPFCSYLAKARDRGVMPAPAGCAPGAFCSADPVTRLEAAFYVVRGAFPSFTWSSSAQHFSDVPPSSPFYHYVQQLRDAGITSGCTPTTYDGCSSPYVTRGQLAVFLMRARYGEVAGGPPRFDPPSTPLFDDVPSSHPFFRHVQQLGALGITSGCSPTQFCPDAPVTKGQVATLLTRTFFPGEVSRAAPFAGRPKDLRVEFRCSDGLLRNASVPADAEGQTAVVACPDLPGCTEDAATLEFRRCLDSSGSGSTCRIAAGEHTVCSALRIRRTGISVITGGSTVDPGATVLRRGTDEQSIMVADVPIGSVTISYLTFDGNRYGVPGLACRPGNSAYYDLVLSGAAGPVNATWLRFVSSPGDSLHLGGTGSTLSFSTFGRGTASIPPRRSGARSTSIWLFGSGSGAYYNWISHSGTAAINVHGRDQIIYGNRITGNRYEISDGSGGGQLYVDADALNASIAGNVIDGEHWETSPSTLLESGCPPPPQRELVAGVEAYGFGHRFYNNAVRNHSGGGMQLAGSNPTGLIVVSSDNPWSLSDAVGSPRYIENNHSGVGFLGRAWGVDFVDVYGGHRCDGGCGTGGVILDRLLVRNNRAEGVYLDSVIDASGYTGFSEEGCIFGNGRDIDNVNAPHETLTHSSPARVGWRGMPCPWTSAGAPASSGDPRWPW